MVNSPLKVPEVTFEQAIAFTQSLLSQVEADQLKEPELATIVSELVKTENGARGFFVTYLTSESSIADNPPTAVVQALQTSPEVALLVKNLAMSAAQAVYHRRNHKEDMAQDSERVHQRTARLIELVDLPAVYDRLQQLQQTITTGEGSYKAFLERWGYDTEQKQIISQALQQVISHQK